MRRFLVILLGVLGAASLALILPSRAAESDVYVYTNEGKSNVTRSGKTSELRLDMPIKNGDLFKIEPESWIDYVFFYSVGLRVSGPSEVLAKNVTSLSGIEMRATGGNVLIHTERTGESFQFSLETPHAIIKATEPVLAQVLIEPTDKKGGGGTTRVFVKKGWIDVITKLSDASIRVLENQKVEINPETFVPPAMGAQPEDLKPAERARTVYVPNKKTEEKSKDF